MENNRIGKLTAVIHRKSQSFYTKELKIYNITSSEYPVIFKLSCGDGITQDEIVNDLGIDKGAVARIIKSLIDKGLIEKNKDEVDKRCNRVFLTEKGKQAIKKSIEKWNGIVTKNMSDKEEKELKRLLLMAIENIKEEIWIQQKKNKWKIP